METKREQAIAILDRLIAVEKFYADRRITLQEHTIKPDDVRLIREALNGAERVHNEPTAQ